MQYSAEITLLDAAGAIAPIEKTGDESMTLEDFLAKSGRAAAAEPMEMETADDAAERLSGGVFCFDSVGFGNGIEMRGKRKVVVEPLDKATLQRQRRMIKNRESAARSRERKQAHQVELQSMAARLEEENEELLRDKAQRTQERFKQLMEKVIPVTEKRRPPLALRRVCSMQW